MFNKARTATTSHLLLYSVYSAVPVRETSPLEKAGPPGIGGGPLTPEPKSSSSLWLKSGRYCGMSLHMSTYNLKIVAHSMIIVDKVQTKQYKLIAKFIDDDHDRVDFAR